ncbi:MAG: alkaline phosphatase D family protein [Pseudomonadota bacterium]|nr:alkaline phosphatase D family protein [Pseudomonadota bacterium]
MLSRRSLLWSLSLPLIGPGCAALDPKEIVTLRADPIQPLTRIAFGSCLRQNRPQPIWPRILGTAPDLFVHLGDNIYGDTENLSELKFKYARLWGDPGYRMLRRRVPVVATWDDHDFGRNNAGREFPAKAASKQVFCDFFGEPASSERRVRDGGIFTSYVFGPEGRRVQLLMLDVRYDRSPLVKVPPEQRADRRARSMGYYRPNTDPNARILGADQWTWLEGELLKPAELRLIASGTRVLAEETGHEEWANFPRERQRLFDLIRRTKANGVLFVSGDPHFSEYSQIADSEVPYPLWEMTSSALNQYNRRIRRNIRRVSGPYGEPNFGLIEILWAGRKSKVVFSTRNLNGMEVLRQEVAVEALKNPGS